MRTKEYAHDYRYFPEPDLMPVRLADSFIDELKQGLPELPQIRRERFVAQYGLPEYDSRVLVADKDVADFFETAAAGVSNAKAVSNWVMTEVLRHLSSTEIGIAELKLTPMALAELVSLVEDGVISSTSAKEVLGILFEEGGHPAQIAADRGLSQVSDSGELESFVKQAIADNPKSVEDYRGGKTAALQFLMGQVMRMSKGKANPQIVLDMLKKHLD
jgi:aspartyl-tRNA(Asn)/glutamyl-tRNA(Gln) amidotransferase subunit B